MKRIDDLTPDDMDKVKRVKKFFENVLMAIRKKKDAEHQ